MSLALVIPGSEGNVPTVVRVPGAADVSVVLKTWELTSLPLELSSATDCWSPVDHSCCYS